MFIMHLVYSTIYTSVLFMVCQKSYSAVGILVTWASVLSSEASSVCSCIFLLLFVFFLWTPLHIRTSILYFSSATLQYFLFSSLCTLANSSGVIVTQLMVKNNGIWAMVKQIWMWFLITISMLRLAPSMAIYIMLSDSFRELDSVT